MVLSLTEYVVNHLHHVILGDRSVVKIMTDRQSRTVDLTIWSGPDLKNSTEM